MSEIDVRYQKLVDDEANELLRLSPAALLETSDYGTMSRRLGATDIEIAWWHFRYAGDVHHIVLKTSRRLFPPFSRDYTSGVVFGPGVTARLMRDDETADYD